MPLTVLVLGETNEMGEALCRRFVQDSNRLVLVSGNLEHLQERVVELEKHGGQVCGICQDIEADGAAQIIVNIIRELGLEVDFLINSVFKNASDYAPNKSIEQESVDRHSAFMSELKELMRDEFANKTGVQVVNINAVCTQDTEVLSGSNEFRIILKNSGTNVTTIYPPQSCQLDEVVEENRHDTYVDRVVELAYHAILEVNQLSQPT